MFNNEQQWKKCSSSSLKYKLTAPPYENTLIILQVSKSMVNAFIILNY